MPIKNRPLNINMFAVSAITGLPATGLLGLTAKLIKDGAAISNATNIISEPNPTGLPGVYQLLLSSDETNCNYLTVGTTYSGNNILIYPQFFTFDGGYLQTISGNIGNPVALNGGVASIAGNIQKIVDNNNGLDFISANDSLKVISTAISAAGPVATTAISGIVNTGTVISGYWDRTTQLNNVYWQMQGSGTGFPINIEAWYNSGAGKIANNIRVYGRYQVVAPTASKWVDVFAWNYIASGWDQVSSSATRMNGQTTSTDNIYTYNLTNSNSDISGNFKVKFLANDTTTTSNLYLDYVPYYYQTTATTASEIANAVYLKMKNTVYQDKVCIDTISGVAGTSIGYNGISTYPVSNMVDALTIANALNVKNLCFKPLSDVILSGTYNGWIFSGKEYSLNLGNQNLDNSVFQYADITGTGLISNINKEIHFEYCKIGTSKLTKSYFNNCDLEGTITLASGNHVWHETSDITNSATTPIIIFQPGAELQCRSYKGGIQVNNMVTGNDLIIDGAGRVIIDSSCSGGNITIRGPFTLVNNSTGTTINDNARYAISMIVESGNINNWATDSLITGYATPSDVNSGVMQLFSSGQIHWKTPVDFSTETNATNNKNTLITAINNTSGSIVTIDQIINSGNLAGWNAGSGIPFSTMSNIINTISGDISNLNNISVNDILNSTVDTQSISSLLTSLLANAQGKIIRSGDSYTYYKSNNTDIAFTLTVDSTTRTRS